MNTRDRQPTNGYQTIRDNKKAPPDGTGEAFSLRDFKAITQREQWKDGMKNAPNITTHPHTVLYHVLHIFSNIWLLFLMRADVFLDG